LTARSVSIHPAALDEALAAVEWYAKRSQRASELFLEFRETLGGIGIVAVAHSRRKPGYWRDRL
jgi:hypothetical protein